MKPARGPVGVFFLLVLWFAGVAAPARSAPERRMALPPLLCERPEAYPLFGRKLKWADPKDNRIGHRAAAILQEKLGAVSALAILDVSWTEQDRDLDPSSEKWRQARVDLLGQGSYAVHQDTIVLEFAVTDMAARRVVYRAKVKGSLKAWPDLTRQLGDAAAVALRKSVGVRTRPAVSTEPPKVTPVEPRVEPRPPAPREPIAVAKPTKKARPGAPALPTLRRAQGYCDRGVALVKKGDYEEAIRDFTQAIELKAAYVSAYSHRGNAYGQKGDFARAIRDFDKVIQFRPYHPDAYADRAVAHYYRKAYDRAWADVKTCRRLGGKVNPALLDALKNATGRSE